LACLGAGEKQAGTHHQNRQGYRTREAEKRIRNAGSDRHGLYRIPSGSGRDIAQQLFAPAFDVV
jgi:hypothetical protein